MPGVLQCAIHFQPEARIQNPEARAPNLAFMAAEGEVWSMEERPAKAHQEDTMGTMGG